MCLAEKDFRRFLVEHDDLAPFLDVGLVDEASGGGFDRFHFDVVGIDSQQAEIDVFRSIADVGGALV